MDQLLSQMFPTHRVGNSFNWWVGQIEETAKKEKNNKGGYRFKVRIVGDHPKSKEILSTEDLPWAQVMMPVNVPFMPGNVGGAHPQLIKGCWVVGFYLDDDKQKPIIMGSIGQTPGATTISKSEKPGATESFQTYNNTTEAQVDPGRDGTPAPQNEKGPSEETNKTTGALPDGTTNADGPKVPPIPFQNNFDQEKWCQSVAEKCDKEDIGDKITYILGQFLFEIQRNNGNIGTYLVGQVNGTINSGIGIARKYISKFQKVIRKFVAKVKGFVIENITKGVKFLIKTLLFVDKKGNALTPVTKWFNNLLKDLGCKMEDLGKRLEKWLTDVIMKYVNQIYRAAACQVDTFINGILSKMNSLMEEVLQSVLGPLQSILGAIASPLNMIGGAINFVLNLLGISCSGPSRVCAKYKVVCTDGEKKKKEDKKDFLDDLLSGIDDLFGSTKGDYNQYTCAEAYTGSSLSVTNVGFVGGVPAADNTTNTPLTRRPKISYDIQDITVQEGNEAQFTVVRRGFTEIASSVTYKTLSKGTAESGVDYLPVQGILGFAPDETEKVITITTLYDSETEGDEDFYIRLRKNSPGEGSGVQSSFVKNIAKCTITEQDLTDPTDPFSPKPENPESGIDDTFPPDETDVPTDPTDDNDTGGGGDGGDGSDGTTESTSPTYRVVADKSFVREGEFIVYTITTTNLENGSILNYSLTGDGITSEDIIGGNINGSFVVNNNQAKVTVGLEDDGVVEDDEILRFTIDGTGAIADVLIVADDTNGDDDTSDYDEGEGETPENTYQEFRDPTVDSGKIITDENGGIIEIPIDDPGDAWAEPPYVFIGGEGIGAVATPLLDEDGFITEIRIKSPGYGYKLNLASDAGVRCIIDSFTVLSPGVGYTETPELYINGQLGVAEAVINEDGFVIGARVLDRELTFEGFPEIVVVGGGGYGATMLPSLVCLDTDGLSTIGSTKIGTGRYVDCP
ncbi:putative base plate hub subunit and tail lysozyme [Synechococcus phage S-RSM4]|uniref:Putative base plate hub subunit and tail lysozyme n=1 Tax=Synechococcus phage S-RSM4 TaxID=555387 RepID=C7BVJ3_9CAUD|nr:baseplate hub subunit and tail lysozyme [Synechococcus phage S-RSM4]CAR63422.1 putative base plate hub subunit and tail lysozyme [Synechococcus phage S-RSM4]